MSLVMMLPRVNNPPAPDPHMALASMRLSMLPAEAHQAVANANITRHQTNRGLRPTASDSRANSGWNAVEVKRNDVDSHDAD